MKTLIENVFQPENLVPKRVGLSYISAENFMTAKLHHEELMSTALEFYTSHMIKNMPSTADVPKLDAEARNKAMNLFKNKKSFGQKQWKNEYFALLKKKLDAEYNRLVVPFLKEQKLQREARLQKTLEDAIRSHRDALSYCLHGLDYHKFHLIDQQKREAAKSEIAKVTGYTKPQGILGNIKENLITGNAKLENEKWSKLFNE
ncbi:hypothetical protein B566_EDAN017329, partial [Ephemera danica]